MVSLCPVAAYNSCRLTTRRAAPWALHNGMGALKNALGPSQYHHHPSGPSKVWPKPSASWTGYDGGDDPSKPTLSISRGGDHPTSLEITRDHPPTGKPGKDKDCDDKDKSTQKPGPSQWHHKPGPSQYYHGKDGKKHSWDGSEGDGSNVHVGSGAKQYEPYVVKPGSHGGAANDGNDWYGSGSGTAGGGKDSGNGKDGGKDGKDAQNFGPSASARARMSEKTKQDGLYALYGQAAASACGLDAQMAGAEITACPLETGSGWDCLNLASTLSVTLVTCLLVPHG